jgi:hypothetical protein
MYGSPAGFAPLMPHSLFDPGFSECIYIYIYQFIYQDIFASICSIFPSILKLTHLYISNNHKSCIYIYMDDEPCVMDIEHCRCIYVTSHPYNMYHQTALFYQDWKPLASSRGDSQGEDGEASGEGDAASGDLDGEPIEESELLGQPLFPDSPLEMLMDELEKQLPEVPVQGPSAPQVPSPKRPQTEESRPKVEAPGIHLDVSPRVVATPCRAESVAPTVLDTPMTKGSSSPESNKAGYYFYLLIACSIHFILMILYIHIHKYNWHHG